MSQVELVPHHKVDYFCKDAALALTEQHLQDDTKRQKIGTALLDFIVNGVDYTGRSEGKEYVFQWPFELMSALVAVPAILPLNDTAGHVRAAEEANKFLQFTTDGMGMRARHFAEQFFENMTFNQFYEHYNKTYDYYAPKRYIKPGSFRPSDMMATQLDENFNNTLAHAVFLNHQDVSITSDAATQRSNEMIAQYKAKHTPD